MSSPLHSRGTGSRRQCVNKRARLCSSTTVCGRSTAAWRWLSGCRLPLPAPWDYLQKLKTVWPLDFLSLRESKTQSLARSRIRPVNAAPVATELRESVSLLQLPGAAGWLAVPAPALPPFLHECCSGEALSGLSGRPEPHAHVLWLGAGFQARSWGPGGWSVCSEGGSKMAESSTLSFF